MQYHWLHASTPPDLGDEAHVWAISLDVNEERARSYEELLSTDELARAQAFRVDGLAPRFIAAHGALRIILGRYLDQRPERLEFGSEHRSKPRLIGGQSSERFRFNFTHSGELALLAVVEDCEVGIDVECVREINSLESLAERYFHSTEVLDIMSAPNRQVAFFRHWTAKEAVLKAFGSGITERLDHFQVPPSETSSGWVDVSTMPSFHQVSQCWVTRLSPCENFEAAIAFLGPERRVRGLVFDV